MQPSTIHHHEYCCFPRQKVLYDCKAYSRELLTSVLDTIYEDRSSFTGYLQFADNDNTLLFLFFFNGSPYAAGRYADGKPACYSIQELGGHVVRSVDKSLNVTLCETDPVLLKSMLLFLQEEPAIKSPTSLLDFEYIVRQIGEAGANAMIALSRDNCINFFFFREGKAALVHYGDQEFSRSTDLTITEEMLLYAFQPDKVQAYIYRDMITTMSEDSGQIGKEELRLLLTQGYLVDRRTGRAQLDGSPNMRRREDRSHIPDHVEAVSQKPKLPSVILTVESGPLQGERFTLTLPCTIGRKDCDLILDDRQVSRRHAALKIVEHKLEIEDLASTNGIMVNGSKVTTCRLHPKDLITIGPMTFRISAT